jgi:carbon-monoxide dehydrogenase large subunit
MAEQVPEADGPWIGRPLPRFEDARLISGRGRYTSDFRFQDECHAVFCRSEVAHARILSIDVSEALRQPGVLAVLTGEDYLAAGGVPIQHFADPADALDHTRRAFRDLPGAISIDIPQLPLPTDRLRYVGEPYAMVVARSQAEAQDAAELVDIELEELPCLIDMHEAVADGAMAIEPEIAGNLAVRAEVGDAAAVEEALAGAHLVVAQDYVHQRIVNAQMEPRAAIAEWDAERGVLRMVAGSQGAVRQRDTLAQCLNMELDKVQLICPDVGGGFGPRTNLAPEQPMLALAAKALGRPVRWTSTRGEAFLSDYQGRDIAVRMRLGFSREGDIIACAAELTGDVGAYTVAFVPLSNSYRVLPGPYHVPLAAVSIRGVMTNTVPTAPYRGAGRPEATHAMERTLDIAARRLGIDRVELRRRNLVGRAQLPYRTAVGLTYDSGDFVANMERVLALADHPGFAARRADARSRGRLAGFGLANYVESPVGIPHERIDLSVDAAAEKIIVVAGTQSTGQGHETSFAQVVADALSVHPDRVSLVTGDTVRVKSGGGTHSDRSMRLGGTLLVETSSKIVAQAREVIARRFEVEVHEVDFDDGLFRIKDTNRSFTIFDAARIEDDPSLPDERRSPLQATASFTGRIPAYPTGAAVCEVEIDPCTGQVEITRYASVDDVGQPINPLILHGQVHGGIAQGVGQALCEAFVHEGGQVTTGTFMDYAMPRADNLPNIRVDLVEDPTSGNPLRVKGGGESGITPALATTMNAIVDALSEFGVEHIDMPATPARVWEAIRAARCSDADGGTGSV